MNRSGAKLVVQLVIHWLYNQQMLNITVMNRLTAETCVPPVDPHAIISITTPGTSPARVATNDNTLSVLQLTFFDVDRIENIPYDLNESSNIIKLENQSFEPRRARDTCVCKCVR